MRIKFGSIVTEGSGKIGGHVAVKNRSGALLRSYSPAIRQNNSSTSKSKSNMGVVAAAWSALSASQKTLWNNATSQFRSTDVFGDIKRLSGFSLFQKLNLNLLICGAALLTLPPSPNLTPLSASPVALEQIFANNMYITLPYVEVDTCFYLISAAVNISAGVSFLKNEYRLIYVFDSYPTYQICITNYINAIFGSVGAVGSRFFCKLVVVNKLSGLASPPGFDNIMITE